MLGEFSFDTMSSEGWKGEVFLGLYLLTCLVLMINILIALLSIKYSELASYSSGLYLQNVIEEQPRWAYHPLFNIFTFRVSILNAVPFLSLPCLLRCSRKKRAFIEKTQYFPAYLFALGLVVLVDVVCIPSAWLKLIKKSVRMREGKAVLLSLFLFPFIALIIMLTDTVMAICKLWSPLADFSREQEERSGACSRLEREDLVSLRRILSTHYKDSNECVALKTVAGLVREELPFTCTLADIAKIALPLANST